MGGGGGGVLVLVSIIVIPAAVVSCEVCEASQKLLDENCLKKWVGI